MHVVPDSLSLKLSHRLFTKVYNVLHFLYQLKLDPHIKRQHLIQVQNYCKKREDTEKMVNPKRVVSYEEIRKFLQHHPEKVIIDVREPEEVRSTGKIPSSINIPLNNVDEALNSMSSEEFQNKYNCSKPTPSDELIFYCKSGRRSTEALDKALKLGYTNSKTYLGSWNEWSSKQQ